MRLVRWLLAMTADIAHRPPARQPSFSSKWLWCINRARDGLRPLCLCSGDLSGERHAEAGHAVDHRTGDAGFDLLRGQSPGPEAPADQNLVPVESGFNQGPLSVTNGFLPAHSAFVGEHLNVLVALRVSAVSLRTAFDLGGMTTVASG
jgi:hypothetical protein